MLHANPGLLLHMQSFSLELNTTRRARGSPSEDIMAALQNRYLPNPTELRSTTSLRSASVRGIRDQRPVVVGVLISPRTAVFIEPALPDAVDRDGITER